MNEYLFMLNYRIIHNGSRSLLRAPHILFNYYHMSPYVYSYISMLVSNSGISIFPIRISSVMHAFCPGAVSPAWLRIFSNQGLV